jgi:PTS system galactitol-specific IIA component
MGLSHLFSDELVIVNLNCSTSEEAITIITELLVKSGYVKPNYLKSIIEREMQFPTGLPTKPFPVAIAHADPKNVIRSGIAVGILREPIAFHEMGTPTNVLAVTIIFVLAIREAEKQTNILQELISILSDKSNNSVIKRLRSIKCSEDATNILQSRKVD